MKQFILSVIIFCFCSSGWPQTSKPDDILTALSPSHPRLFANDTRIAQIKLQQDEVSKELLFIIKNDAEKKLTEPQIDYPNGVSNMGTSRNVQSRIISLAMGYRLLKTNVFFKKQKKSYCS